ncbi:pyridoxal phosphate homeostasis protein [Caerostris darwini]|uniref:Pyridoxal phosphate homeostasis protein n=1 Tax=Caerostris darwini TaxID=1538125 RepID=A0AAV4MHQ3_9ARAC|nr:pyridoxal phosphate homeostasis protein [Caerostris darwini]
MAYPTFNQQMISSSSDPQIQSSLPYSYVIPRSSYSVPSSFEDRANQFIAHRPSSSMPCRCIQQMPPSLFYQQLTSMETYNVQSLSSFIPCRCYPQIASLFSLPPLSFFFQQPFNPQSPSSFRPCPCYPQITSSNDVEPISSFDTQSVSSSMASPYDFQPASCSVTSPFNAQQASYSMQPPFQMPPPQTSCSRASFGVQHPLGSLSSDVETTSSMESPFELQQASYSMRPSFDIEPATSYDLHPRTSPFNVRPIASSFGDIQTITTYEDFEPIISSFDDAQPMRSSFDDVQPIRSSFNDVQPIRSTFDDIQPIRSSFNLPSIMSSPDIEIPFYEPLTSFDLQPVLSSIKPICKEKSAPPDVLPASSDILAASSDAPPASPDVLPASPDVLSASSSDVQSPIYINIQNSIEKVKQQIEEAKRRRDKQFTDEVKLVAVSKNQPMENICIAYECGLRIFGENYVNELVRKATDPELRRRCPEIKWHFIGKLQSNKVNKLKDCPNLIRIESIESINMANLVQNMYGSGIARLGRLGVMIQVNTSREQSKSGVIPELAADLVKHVLQTCPDLKFHGLMTIGAPNYDVSNGPNPDYLTLLDVKEEITEFYAGKISLSMGMSGDFEHAIEIGSTEVRIGQKIFGPRPKKPETSN